MMWGRLPWGAVAPFLAALSFACSGERPPSESREARFQEHKQEFLSLFRSGNYPAALQAATEALQVAPESTEPYSWVNRMYTELDQDLEGIRFFNQVSRRHPDLGLPLLFRGFHEFHLDRYDDALLSFQRAAELDPQNPECYYRQGMILDQQGKFEQALVAFRRSYELDPGSNRAAKLVTLLRRTGGYDEAEKVVATALITSPESWKLHHAYGLLLLRRADHARAEKSLRRALELEPLRPEPHMDLARVLSLTGREGEAKRERAVGYRLNDYQRSKEYLTDFRDSPYAPMLLAELELTQGKFHVALREFARAERLGASPGRIAAGRAEAYYRMGDLSQGDAALASVRDSDSSRVLLARAARLVATGDGTGAAQLIERAVSQAPEERYFLRRAADLYGDIGRLADSDALLARAVSAPGITSRTDPELEGSSQAP